MSLFAGVSIVSDGKLCTTSPVDAGTENGYHLFLVQGYSRTKEEIPNGESINSGPFMVGGHRWYIEYSPNGDNPSHADFISLYLYLIIDEEDIQQAVEAKFDFSFVDQVEEQKPMRIRGIKTCSFSSDAPSWGRKEFVRRDALERSTNLKGDCFTIRCDIMVCKDPITSRDASEALVSDIGQHLNNLLLNKVGADVTFEVCGETFTAHRCVLAARSTVFMAQLFGPMKEGTKSTVIQIKDMDPKVFRCLLKFIYTGTIFYTDEDRAYVAELQEEEGAVFQMMQDLFIAADMYDLQRLKHLCEEYLSEDIEVSSVASTLVLAEKHYCRGLKEGCLKFIQVQSPPCLQKIMATDGWEHIRTTYPSLMSEITAKLAFKT